MFVLLHQRDELVVGFAVARQVGKTVHARSRQRLRIREIEHMSDDARH